MLVKGWTNHNGRTVPSNNAFHRKLPYAIWAFDGSATANTVRASMVVMVKHILMLPTMLGNQFLMQLEIVVFHIRIMMLGIIKIILGRMVINHFILMMILVGTIQHSVQVGMVVMLDKC